MNTLSELEPLTVARADADAMKPAVVAPVSNGALQQQRPTLVFSVPREDKREFRTLPDSEPCPEQTRVKRRLAWMGRIHQAVQEGRSVRAEAERIAAEQHGEISGERIRKSYALFTATDEAGHLLRTWRCLVDQRAVPWFEADECDEKAAVRKTVPFATINFFITLIEGIQRKSAKRFAAKTAHYELLKIWRSGYDSSGRYYPVIPGYEMEPKGRPPEFRNYGRPKGWSYDNLLELAKRRGGMDNYNLAASGIGLAAASAHAPKVLTTRVGTRIGQQIQFDDHQLNLKVYLPGCDDAQRPEGYFAWDRFSGCMFAHWIKPMLWDDHEEKRRVINEKDFRYFVAAVLLRFGYRRDELKTEFVVEHAKAAIREDSPFAKAIFDATEGFVTINRSGRFGKGAHVGQYDPSLPMMGRGNFRNKPGVEGFFAIMDNFTAVFRGQVGKDRLHCPEQIQGMDRAHNEALKIMKSLPPELAAQIDSPFMKWGEFFQRFQTMMREINFNRDHDCEGWEQMPGFTSIEWRESEALEWQPERRLLTLADDVRSLVIARLESNNRTLMRPARHSRGEVFDTFHKELSTVPWCDLPSLMGRDQALHNPQDGDGAYMVREGVIRFEHTDFGPGKFYYDAVDSDTHRGRPHRFRNGEKFTIYGNPMCRECVVACRLDGAVAGVFPRVNVPNAGDEEGQLQRLAEINSWKAERREEMNARHLGEAELISHFRSQKSEVSGQKPATKLSKLQPTNSAAAETLRRDAALANALMEKE